MMHRSQWHLCVGFVVLVLSLQSSAACATMTTVGDTSWYEGIFYIGYSGDGSAEISEGTVSADQTFMGYTATGSGSLSVSGSASGYNAGLLYVGNRGRGTMSITGGAHVTSEQADVGYNAGSVGEVILEGDGSVWENYTRFNIGTDGTGSMRISDGGTLLAYGESTIGSLAGSGTVTVDGLGSVWRSEYSIYHFGTPALHVGSFGPGLLSITNGGSVICDGFATWIGLSSNGTVTVDGPGSSMTNAMELMVGLTGNGTLNITNGATVSVGYTTYVATGTGSTGVIDFGNNGGTLTTQGLNASPSQLTGVGTINTKELTVDMNLDIHSTASTQTFLIDDQPGKNVVVNLDMTTLSSHALGAGYKSSGTLTIRDGVAIASATGMIGQGTGSSGVARVAGLGSAWNVSGTLTVGSSGTGTLTVSNGGSVSANCLQGNSLSLAVVNVAHGSSLRATSGSGVRSRLLAGPGADTGDCSPLLGAAAAYQYQSFGGKWNSSTRLLTVSDYLTGAAGDPVVISDLNTTQRMLITDTSGATDWTLGLSFMAASASTSVTALPIAGSNLDPLEDIIGDGESVFGAWNLTILTRAACLSFDVGEDQPWWTLCVWKRSATGWTRLPAGDLTYDGTYASFYVSSKGAYAVTTPEPATLVLFAVAVLSFLVHACRKRRNG
jgi:fibronectin-binding autotransporter adhesin